MGRKAKTRAFFPYLAAEKKRLPRIIEKMPPLKQFRVAPYEIDDHKQHGEDEYAQIQPRLPVTPRPRWEKENQQEENHASKKAAENGHQKF
jgi:hypothetical protein